MPVKLGRNPFAREDVRRERVYGDATCGWCGQQKKTPKGRAYLFQYVVSPDGLLNRDAAMTGLFCSLDCCNSYHG